MSAAPDSMMSKSKHPHRLPSARVFHALAWLIAVVACASSLHASVDWLPLSSESLLGAQEWQRPTSDSLIGAEGWVRPSIAAAQTAAHRDRIFGISQTGTVLDYNFKLGPIAFKFAGGLSTEFNDNITISDDDRQSDVIIRPNLTMIGSWPITRFNTLTLQLGFGYTKYLSHPEFDSPSTAFEIDPGITKLAFDVKIGDFYINFHDRPAIQQAATSELTLRNFANTFAYSRFTNVIGVSVLWDLNRVQISAGYDHNNLIPLQSEFKYLQQSTDQLNGSFLVKVNDSINTGLQGSCSSVSYSEHVQNDSINYHFGPFCEIRLTRFLRLNLSAGCQGGIFESGGANRDSSDLNGYYANASINHNLNAYISQNISIGHESQLGTFSNFVETDYLRHAITWNLLKRYSLTTDAFLENGRESGGISPQDFRLYGFGIQLGCQVTKRLSAGLQYRFTKRDASAQSNSSDTSLAYYQNRISLDFSYAF